MSNLQDKQPMCTYTLGEEREFGHLLFGSINVGYDILCPQKGTLVGFSQSYFIFCSKIYCAGQKYYFYLTEVANVSFSILPLNPHTGDSCEAFFGALSETLSILMHHPP